MASDLPEIDHVPGALLARGREATILELGPGRVLRRYATARDVTREVAVMRHVGRHGFPVPVVHGTYVDPAGVTTGVVLERVEGPSLVEAALSGRTTAAEVGRVLARLHDRLHRIPLDGLPPLPDAEPAQPGDVVVHLDLHPANVLLAPAGPVLIDWANARTGPATLDTGVSALTVAAALIAGVPRDSGDVAALEIPDGFLGQVLDAFLVALAESPLPSLDRAAWVLDVTAAQPPAVVRDALALVRRRLQRGAAS